MALTAECADISKRNEKDAYDVSEDGYLALCYGRQHPNVKTKSRGTLTGVRGDWKEKHQNVKTVHLSTPLFSKISITCRLTLIMKRISYVVTYEKELVMLP